MTLHTLLSWFTMLAILSGVPLCVSLMMWRHRRKHFERRQPTPEKPRAITRVHGDAICLADVRLSSFAYREDASAI